MHYALIMRPEVDLRTLSFDDIAAVLALQLDEGQDSFVAPNEYTLAEAYVALTTGEFTPRIYGIFLGGEVVGMIAIAYYGPGENGEEPGYEFYRFMVDKRRQRQGIGRQALKQMIDILRTKPMGPGRTVETSFVPGNEFAKDLYLSLGFEETGEVDEDGEVIAVMTL